MVHRLPITKARINLGAVAKRAHLSGEYFILEKDGIPVAGIMSADEMEDYLELQDPHKCSAPLPRATQTSRLAAPSQQKPCLQHSKSRISGNDQRSGVKKHDAAFSLRVTARFERDYRNILKDHPDISVHYARVITILAADPYNRSRSHAIKKLASAKRGDGQYRIRFHSFRFIYDTEGQAVFLKHCRLRREDTY